MATSYFIIILLQSVNCNIIYNLQIRSCIARRLLLLKKNILIVGRNEITSAL
jgi:hypothetical protein